MTLYCLRYKWGMRFQWPDGEKAIFTYHSVDLCVDINLLFVYNDLLCVDSATKPISYFDNVALQY